MFIRKLSDGGQIFTLATVAITNVPATSKNLQNPTTTTTTAAQTNNSNKLTSNIDNETALETNNGTKTKDPSSATSSPSEKHLDVVLTSLTAGAIAGALAKTTIAPLDRTKINFQINKDARYSFKSAFDFIKQTYAKEGIVALWRGNSATMARIVPYAAIQFTAHEQWRKVLHVDQDGTDTKFKRFLAGALAGITSQSLTYPLDLARARMAVTDKYSGYKTLRQVFVKIWVEEGPRTLYRGYWATVLGVIPYAGTSFFTYETLKREYKDITSNAKLNTLVSLTFGAIAGAVGQTSSYPFDIVRRRMQTMGITHDGENKYSTIYGTLKAIYKEEGIKNGFYKGLSMNWIKGPIAVGISFSTYDLIKEFIRELFHLKRGRSPSS